MKNSILNNQELKSFVNMRMYYQLSAMVSAVVLGKVEYAPTLVQMRAPTKSAT